MIELLLALLKDAEANKAANKSGALEDALRGLLGKKTRDKRKNGKMERVRIKTR